MYCNEAQFKTKLLNIFNNINPGWEDGDSDESVKGKRVDLVNHELKIVIEIKDDGKFKEPINDEISVSLRDKNRQFKTSCKDTNKKFKNYLNYKSVLLYRIDSYNQSLINAMLNGPINLSEHSIVEYPSNLFQAHDFSINEIGVFLFCLNDKIYFLKNYNPNVIFNRFISKEELESITGFTLTNLINI